MQGGDFMSSGDVCDYCQFSYSVLNRLQTQGVLTPVRVLPASKKRFFLRSDVKAYMNNLRQGK